MTKKLILALALLLPTVPRAAQALDTSRTYQVQFEGNLVGTWNLRHRVEDLGDTCRYTIQWKSVNSAPLSRTRLCKLDESKASDNFDCKEASMGFFDTIVMQNCPCFGFDEFGQPTDITSLMAGESQQGSLVGIVTTASIGDVQSLSVN